MKFSLSGFTKDELFVELVLTVVVALMPEAYKVALVVVLVAFEVVLS